MLVLRIAEGRADVWSKGGLGRAGAQPWDWAWLMSDGKEVEKGPGDARFGGFPEFILAGRLLLFIILGA